MRDPVVTEQQARQLCKERGRDPDREMAGPFGPMKAWEMYNTTPSRAARVYCRAFQRHYETQHYGALGQPNT